MLMRRGLPGLCDRSPKILEQKTAHAWLAWSWQPLPKMALQQIMLIRRGWPGLCYLSQRNLRANDADDVWLAGLLQPFPRKTLDQMMLMMRG